MASIMRTDPFEDLLRGFFIRPAEFEHDMAMDMPVMKVDLREKDDTYTLHAELPGVKKEDIHIRIEGSTVMITAERKLEHEVTAAERVLRSERRFGRISRSFDLGVMIDEDKASAHFSDGVLELSLPHKLLTEARQLMIA